MTIQYSESASQAFTGWFIYTVDASNSHSDCVSTISYYLRKNSGCATSLSAADSVDFTLETNSLKQIFKVSGNTPQMDSIICVWAQTIGQVSFNIPFTVNICGGETISPTFSNTISLLFTRDENNPYVTINL